MRERFPGFGLHQLEDRSLAWIGELEPVAGYACVVAVSYPATYPYAEPRLDILDPPLEPDAPHRYQDGSICVHKHEWQPERGTAASMIPLLSGWWVAYVHWVKGGGRF